MSISCLKCRLVLGLLLGFTRMAWAQDPARPDSTRDSVVALPAIEVTATRGTVPLDLAPLAVTVVDRNGLGRARQDLALDDILSGIPGVYLANRYNFSLDQRLSIRGFGSRANFGLRGVRVLLDGVPQTLPDGQGQLTNVDFGLIDRIEVIRGSASSLHGNASGGVIALESRRPSQQPFSQTARIEGGAFGMFRWQSHTSARRGSLAGSLTVSRFSLDGFRDHSRAEATQVQAAAEYLVSGSTSATVRLAHASAPRADNPGALTLAELNSDRDAAAPNNVTRSAGKDAGQQQASVTVRHFGSGDNALEVTLFGLRRQLDNPLATGVFVDLGRTAGGLRFSLAQSLGQSARAPRLTIGTDVQRMRDDRRNSVASGGQPTDSTLIQQIETVTELGPFVHLLWQPAEFFLLSGGIRYDRVSFQVDDRHLSDGVDNSGSRTMAAWSGHFGVSIVRLGGVVPYANISTSFETPTTTELANRPGGSGGFNDQLEPQRAVNYELGVRGEIAPALTYSAAVFLGRIRDGLIQFSEVGGRAFFSNAGRLHNDGFEAGVRLAPAPSYELSATYTYARYRFEEYRIVSGTTVDTLDGNRLAGVPAHFLRLALALKPIGALRLEVEQQISSSLFADDANTIEVEGWGAGVTTLRASWSVRTGSLELVPFFGINNLFDRPYVSSVTVNGFGGRVFEPAPGRNAYLGMEVGYRSPL